MFLHIGADVEVMKKDIVAIFDMESLNSSKISTEFINVARLNGNICDISGNEPKSIILLDINKNVKIYLSPISSITLQKRIDFVEKLM